MDTYEKKYKEALERASNLHKDAVEMENNMTTKTCEIIFPELRESEDEKIRNMLIEFFSKGAKNNSYTYNISDKDIVAWLEKQGEKKPADKEYTFKAIPRLLEMIQPTDRAKSYCQKLIGSLEQEGHSTDAKIVRDCLKQMNGEKVAMATMDEEPVSEDLEQAAHQRYEANDTFMDGFKKGAKWQKEHLWKPADGDDLPDIDRDVIVLTQHYPLEGSEYAVSFAHRPNPNGWDGKSVTTGKVEHYTPKTYDKGGWNIPNVKYWLDYDINELLCRENETDN